MAAPKKLKQPLRVSLFLDAGRKAELDRLAARLDRLWSELAREGVELVLAKYKGKLKESTR